MSVTFGTVEVIPAAAPAAATPASSGAASSRSAAAPAIDPRELAAAERHLAARELRVRAH